MTVRGTTKANLSIFDAKMQSTAFHSDAKVAVRARAVKNKVPLRAPQANWC